MHPHEKKSLDEIVKKLKECLGDRISAVYVFGSRVRGDFGGWSDFDVLVILKDRTPEIEEKVIGIFVDEEIKAGLSFSPVIKDIRSFEQEKKHHTPFYENIMREGVPL